jgi:hypothetical protein
VQLRDAILGRLGAPTTVEDAALTLLALRRARRNPEALISAQQSSGAWPATFHVGLPSVYHTALALLALREFDTPPTKEAADRAFRWLATIQGREAHWLWQWKFRLFDRQVRFDLSKYGWPWIPDTVSWVAPTALSILAVRCWRRSSPRLKPAADMLLDRACAGGGWNAGNSMVFGVNLDPHPDFTSMAVLALHSFQPQGQSQVEASLNYLAARLREASSPYSLAWGVMALSAYAHDGTHRLRSQLEERTIAKLNRLPDRVLALAALSLEDPPYTFVRTEQ